MPELTPEPDSTGGENQKKIIIVVKWLKNNKALKMNRLKKSGLNF
jgi:hypothetical protein